jgi:integrase/recombinase XerD
VDEIFSKGFSEEIFMEEYFKQPAILLRMRQGLLGPYLDLLAKQLKEKGYTHETAQRHLSIVAGFSQWLEKMSVPIREICSQHIQKYMKARRQRKLGGVATALKAVLNVLHEQNAVAPRPTRKKKGSIEIELEEYVRYLLQERGLRETTVQYYKGFIKRFLIEKFPNGKVIISNLRPSDVIEYVQRQASKLRLSRSKLMTTVLRSFLQYAKYRGFVENDLAAAVPTVANWTMAGIPKALPIEKTEKLLSSCDRKTALGRRDYAILMLLARLGLRAGEIVSLKLDDVDWDAGSIRVRGKGGLDSLLPLPTDVGEAIASYLRRGRPKSSVRFLFLTGRAPISGFSGHSLVSWLVAKHLDQAGVESFQKGAHQLRPHFTDR